MTLATGDDGRAEIQFEDGSVARISPDSSLTLSALRGQGLLPIPRWTSTAALPTSNCREAVSPGK